MPSIVGTFDSKAEVTVDAETPALNNHHNTIFSKSSPSRRIRRGGKMNQASRLNAPSSGREENTVEKSDESRFKRVKNAPNELER